jgi:two-component system, LytTR family, sensor kinase
MRWYRPNRVEWTSFAIMMPLLMLVMHLLLYGTARFLSPEILLFSYPINTAFGLFVWYTLLACQQKIRGRFRSYGQSLVRTILLISVHIVATVVYFVVVALTFDHFHFFGYTFNTERYWIIMLTGLVFSLVSSGIYEGWYILHQWKQNVDEKEVLKSTQIQAEFELLKRQVSPHFLFNSLNSLSSLISVNPAQAEVFLEKLSNVYRYLLQNNEDDLIPVERELRFIDSYNHLLATRFGKGYQSAIEVSETYRNYLVPPLTLQILVENAVKHNVIHADTPLSLRIYNEGSKLFVINNLQKKPNLLSSNGVGLSNIISKYRLLKLEEVDIQETDDLFVVIVPLIKPNQAENNGKPFQRTAT